MIEISESEWKKVQEIVARKDKEIKDFKKSATEWKEMFDNSLILLV